jgi:hypothetical protein
MQLPMHRALKCRARTRSGQPCQAPAMWRICRIPGGNDGAYVRQAYLAEATPMSAECYAAGCEYYIALP